MSESISTLLQKLEQVRHDVRTTKTNQIFSVPLRATLNEIASDYFSEVVPIVINLEGVEKELQNAEAIFKGIHTLSRKNCSKQKCLAQLKASRECLVRLEGAALSGAHKKLPGSLTRTDGMIIETLKELCPSASLSYEQAIQDLQSTSRMSWRGPATDLREALRETLDVLAPDKEVESMPGYKLEVDAKRPTMRQKVRFILRNRGYGSGQLATPESAIEGVEGLVGGVVRSVYTRSNVSTHIITTREEVLRVHAWVRIVLCELLELPA